MLDARTTLQGLWKTRGYGKLFEVTGEQFCIYDLSPLSCTLAASGTLDEFLDAFDRLDANAGDVLSLYARGGITRYTLDKAPAFPHPLLEASQARAEDPGFNFSVFWHYFQDNYAFFDLRGANWQQVRNTWQPRVEAADSPAVLQDAIRTILIELGDSHATLTAGTEEISTKKPHALVRHWQQEFNSTEFLALYPRGIPRLRAYIEERILDGTGASALDGQLLWGRLQPGVGYLALFSLMNVYAGFEQLHFAGFETASLAYLQRLEEALDAALEALGGMHAVVLDLRFNLGGHDGAGLRVARRFADHKRLAFTKQACHEGGFTQAQNIWVEPLPGRSFTGPVALLTSEATASAAEALVHAMMPLPHVLRVGGSTRGVLSDMLLMRLPNGWQVSLSNEVYRAADGCCYEGRGVPPQVEAPTFQEPAFYDSLHLTISQALESLGLRSEL